MASVEVTYTFMFDPDEVALLLKLVGRESRVSIEGLGMDAAVQERVYNVLSEAAYDPMREDAP